MSTRRPIVLLTDGSHSEMPAGDTLPGDCVPSSGGSSGGGVKGAASKLVITVTTSTALTITADEVVLETSANDYLIARAVSLTVGTGTAGANGLDTGSMAASTWYYVHVISNGTTTAGLISLSATAPTLPSGYTYSGRVGAVRTNSSGNLIGTIQRGRTCQYKVGLNLSNMPIMATGPAGSYSTPTWSTVATGSFVPPTASHIRLTVVSISNANVIVAPNASYGADASLTNPPFAGGAITRGYIPINMLLESSNVYWAAYSGSNVLACQGWEDNL